MKKYIPHVYITTTFIILLGNFLPNKILYTGYFKNRDGTIYKYTGYK